MDRITDARVLKCEKKPWKSCLNTVIGGAIFLLTVGAANAHSFNVALISDGAGGAARIQSAVNGFLIASAERDGHSDETADGHLGGLDVFLSPLPTSLSADIKGLIGQTYGKYDLAIVLGDDNIIVTEAGVVESTVIARLGKLPDPAQRTGFAEKFRARFNEAPNDAAAQGYNAARRIDQAVRLLGNASQSDELRDALATTADGIGWDTQ